MEGRMDIDWIAVFIAAFINMLIGYLWYSKWLLGPIWKKHSKNKEEKMGLPTLAMGFGVSLLIAYFIAFFASALAITTVLDGMCLGFFLWLGFVATTQAASPIWTKGSWMLFAVETGYKFVSFVVMAGIIGA